MKNPKKSIFVLFYYSCLFFISKFLVIFSYLFFFYCFCFIFILFYDLCIDFIFYIYLNIFYMGVPGSFSPSQKFPPGSMQNFLQAPIPNLTYFDDLPRKIFHREELLAASYFFIFRGLRHVLT